MNEIQGIAFAREPFGTPCCHIAVLQDPHGNKLVIHKLNPQTRKESANDYK